MSTLFSVQDITNMFKLEIGDTVSATVAIARWQEYMKDWLKLGRYESTSNNINEQINNSTVFGALFVTRTDEEHLQITCSTECDVSEKQIMLTLFTMISSITFNTTRQLIAE